MFILEAASLLLPANLLIALGGLNLLIRLILTRRQKGDSISISVLRGRIEITPATEQSLRARPKRSRGDKRDRSTRP